MSINLQDVSKVQRAADRVVDTMTELNLSASLRQLVISFGLPCFGALSLFTTVIYPDMQNGAYSQGTGTGTEEAANLVEISLPQADTPEVDISINFELLKNKDFLYRIYYIYTQTAFINLLSGAVLTLTAAEAKKYAKKIAEGQALTAEEQENCKFFNECQEHAAFLNFLLTAVMGILLFPVGSKISLMFLCLANYSFTKMYKQITYGYTKLKAQELVAEVCSGIVLEGVNEEAKAKVILDMLKLEIVLRCYISWIETDEILL